MAEEIQREEYEAYRREIYAHQAALERTIPRFLGAMFGKKGSGIQEAPPIPSYDEVVKNGKIGGGQSNYFTKYDTATPQDTFVTEKWWEKRTPIEEGSEHEQEVAFGGMLTYVPDDDEEGFERMAEAAEQLKE